jgi:glycerol kinase
MAGYYLGIDQGTTVTTALLIDENWNIISRGRKEHRQIYPRSGWVEHDPIDIYESCLEVVQTALKGIPGAKVSDIVCMGIDHQGETCLIWDRKTGEPVYNAIVWLDRRSADSVETLKKNHNNKIHQITGLIPDAYYSSMKLKWILDNVDGVRERVERGELLAGTLNTWLIWKFTGGRVHVTDASSGGKTMLMDLTTTQWDDWLLNLMDIPRNILPPILNCNEVFGYTDPDSFLDAKIPIAGCLTDSNAGLVGGGGSAPGTLKTSYGTGCFMGLVTGDHFVISRYGLTSTCCWKINGVPSYSLNGAAYTAGAAIQWLRDGIRIIDNVAQTEVMARSVPDTKDVYFVPAFAGLATPYWDQYARGAFLGLTAGVNRENLVRAVLESVAFQTADCFMAMSKEYKGSIYKMRADGGMVDNSFLMQFQADMLGIPVELPYEKETAAYGSACMAGLTIGALSALSDVNRFVKIKKVYEPSMSEDERQARFEKWHRAVERSRGWIQHDSL